MKLNKTFKKFLWTSLLLFLVMNIVSFIHAYKFTHFTSSRIEKTKDAKELSIVDKLKILITGVNNPRPENRTKPSKPFDTIKLKSNKEIEGWIIPSGSNSKGTVILFHGFSGDKSKMLDKAEIFHELGFNTMLVDFMGSGGSEGNQTTIGFKEAEEVKTCFDYLKNEGEGEIYLFGTSMGSVAILKALRDYNIQPKGIIFECPFGSMYETTAARFKSMNIPSFPVAPLLVFWGGLQNGFWAFSHNPSNYAKAVTCPTLLMYGEQDEKVSRKEIDEIFHSLKGEKFLRTYPSAGHENYLRKYRNRWMKDVKEFLKEKI